jgi:hypothetical protein
MFPGIDGFHWTVGHIVFLCLFFAVAVTILATVTSAAWRTAKDFRDQKAIDLCWKADLQNCLKQTAGAATNWQVE